MIIHKCLVCDIEIYKASQFHCSDLSVYHFPLQEKVFFHSLIYAKYYLVDE